MKVLVMKPPKFIRALLRRVCGVKKKEKRKNA